MANEIFTRLQLKHDTYNAWEAVKDTFRPLPGEICIVEVPAGSSAAQTAPTVLFKVGQAKSETENYTFAELPWASALAADVYAWAKKPEAEFITWVNEQIEHPTLSVVDPDAATKKFITNIEVSDHEVTITRSDVDWDDIVSKPDLALKSDIPTNHKTKQEAVVDPTANGKAIAFIDSISQNENGEITATKKTVNLDEYAKKEDIPESVGVMAVSGADAIKTEGTSDVTISLELDNSGNVTLSQSEAGLKAEYNLKKGLRDDGIEIGYNTANERTIAINGESVKVKGHEIASQFYVGNELKKITDTLGDLATKDTITSAEISDFGTAVAAVKVTNAGTADKVAHKFTVNGVEFDGSAEKSVTIDASTLGLESAMHFVGALTEAPATAKPGDVYLNTATKKEYVYSTEQGWVELGDEGSHALKSITITGTGYLTDGGDLSANRTIDIAAEVKTKIDNGATAYGWGNHAEAGYLKSHQDISGKKNVQDAIADQNLSGATVVKGIAQNEQGVITVSTRNLTPADIGAQPAGNYQEAGNYKTAQEVKSFAGASNKTITSVTQNANGEVEVTYGDIAFPEAIKASGAATIATVADDVVTLKAGATLGEDHKLENATGADITLAKVAKTGNIADLVQTEGTYIVFNCGTATTVV